jgi:hypothetical protein
MKYDFLRFGRHPRFSTLLSLFLTIIVFAAPLCAQQQPTPPPVNAPAKTENQNAPNFDEVLAADSYKMYGEVRNVGQLLTIGGAGEIVEPIIKLADPGPEFKSIVAFLKKHSEALASSRLMFATWPARTGIPSTFVAIEFATPAEAAKFAPQLETFLPTVMPPVPVEPTPTPDNLPPSKPAEPSQAPAAAANSAAATTRVENTSKPAAAAQPSPTSPPATAAKPPETRLPFVMKQFGSLVFISDKPVNLDKLRPKSAAPLAEDHNFRVARDRFSSEPIFLFFNVQLEDRTQPKPSPTPIMTQEERDRIQQEEEAAIQKKIEEAKAEQAKSGKPPEEVELQPNPEVKGVLTIQASPTPTPTAQQQAQTVASAQIGNMLSMLGQGPPQWPDAIGVALALDNDEYVARAILIDSQTSKRLTLPFIPQLISGPASVTEAASILPADTEVVVSASIDFSQTYREMKKQAEASAKETQPQVSAGAPASVDSFAEFEKKAGFKISDDLLPVLGNELAIGVPLKTMNGIGVFGLPNPSPPKSSGDAANEKDRAPELPIILIAIRDRDAVRRLMPRVLDGLGVGMANMLAQTERREDSEIVNYAGMFSYAFVGNFLVISDSASVRRVADANANRQTLSSNNIFRNARRWQPRQTLGEIYVSPKLMEGYQDQVGKQAGMMDAKIRDFLLQLTPASSAITYALSHDGLGATHELHLPKNLILAWVASTSAVMSAMKDGAPEMNEMIAISTLQVLANGEESYKSTTGNGTYGSIEELIEHKLVSKDMFEKYGYKYDVTASSNAFTAVATPAEYGKTGKRSFFIDKTGIVRGDDHGGAPASGADNPVAP